MGSKRSGHLKVVRNQNVRISIFFDICFIDPSLFLTFLNTFSLIQFYCKAITLPFFTFPPLPQIPSHL